MTEEALEPISILAALGVRDAASVTPVEGGADAAIWRVECANSIYALRVLRSDQVETCRREVAVMRATEAAGLPVPLIIRQEMWRDRPAMLLTWCAGQTLRQQLKQCPDQIWKIGAAFGRIHARIHAVTPPKELREPRYDWTAWSGREEPQIRERLRQSASSRDTLLHFDYHPLNVMIEGERITGILDWANADIGDRRADLARTTAMLHLAGTHHDPFIETARRIMLRAWRYGYRQVDASEWRDMPLFYVWGGAWMLDELNSRVRRTGIAHDPIQLEYIQAYIAYWKRRAGIKSPNRTT